MRKRLCDGGLDDTRGSFGIGLILIFRNLEVNLVEIKGFGFGLGKALTGSIGIEMLLRVSEARTFVIH
jgi:hypothetical protein